MNTRGKQLILFDFDGTLTSADSFLRFLWSAVPWYKLLTGSILLFLTLGLWALRGHLTAETAKKRVLAQFFKGKTKEEIEHLGFIFFRRRLPALLRPNVLRLLRYYQKREDIQVALVSASADAWLKPFCKAEKIALICTELAYVQGRFQGDFNTPNCNYGEKVRRIRESFQLDQFSSIRAYGNSKGDQGMFELANEAWLVKRNGGLVAIDR